MIEKRGLFLTTGIFIFLLFMSVSDSSMVDAADISCCVDQYGICNEDVTSEQCFAMGGTFDIDCNQTAECRFGCCIFSLGSGIDCQLSSEATCNEYSQNTFMSQIDDFSECESICEEKSVLYGYIRDSSSATPLGNAQITVTPPSGCSECIGSKTVTSSSGSGYYFIGDDSDGDIGSGTYTISVSRPGYQDKSITVSVSGPTEQTINLLQETEASLGIGTIRGSVYTEEVPNSAIQGADVVIPAGQNDNSRIEGTTNSEGFFEITEIPSGIYEATITAPDRIPVSLTFTIPDTDDSSEAIINTGIFELELQKNDGNYVCCALGCQNENDERIIGNSARCGADGTGIYCSGSDTATACLTEAVDCCIAEDFCPGNVINEDNDCRRFQNMVGCDSVCDEPVYCNPDGTLRSNSGEEYCMCGSEIKYTNQDGYCCDGGLDNDYFSVLPCTPLETRNIRLTVYDNITLEPIQGAIVVVKDSETGRSKAYNTDSNGVFERAFPISNSGDYGVLDYYIFVMSSGHGSVPVVPYDNYAGSNVQTLVGSDEVDFVYNDVDSGDYVVIENPLEGNYGSEIFFRINDHTFDIDLGDIYMPPVISECVLDSVDENTGLEEMAVVELLSARAAQQGKPELMLSWKPMMCDELISFDIFRRDLNGDDEYRKIGSVPANTYSFVDPQSDEWDQEYDYTVVPLYANGRRPQPSQGLTSIGSIYAEFDHEMFPNVTFRTGDAICKDKSFSNGNQEFCSSEEFFGMGSSAVPIYRYQCNENNFKEYGKTDNSEGRAFWDCSDYGPRFVCSGPNEFGNTFCRQQSACDIDTLEADPFGLYYSSEDCYGNLLTGEASNVDGNRYYNYCTMEKGIVVDRCVSCMQYDRCSDYTTKGACEIDNCMVGGGSPCVWIAGDGRDSETTSGTLDFSKIPAIGLGFSSFGEGFCVEYERADPEDDSNCNLCSKENSPFNSNMGCTPELCEFIGYCYSDGDSCISCKENDACSDYTTEYSCTGGQEFSLSSSIADIKSGSYTALGDVATYSADPCSKNFCKWISDETHRNGGYCIKDGNDNDEPDCSEAGANGINCQNDTVPVTLRGVGIETGFYIYGEDGNRRSVDFEFYASEPLANNFGDMAGFMYCIDRTNTCSPSFSTDIIIGGENLRKVTFTPGARYNGNNRVYRHEGFYYLRYIAADEHLNFAKLESMEIYLDDTPPGIEFLSYEVHENASSTEDEILSDLTLDIIMNETSTCEFYLRHEGRYMPPGTPETDPPNLGDDYLYAPENQYESEKREFQLQFTKLPDGPYHLKMFCYDQFRNFNDYYDTLNKDHNIVVDAYMSINFTMPSLPPGTVGTLTPQFFITTEENAECSFYDARDPANERYVQFLLDPNYSEDHFEANKHFYLDFPSGWPELQRNKLYLDGEFYARCVDELTGEEMVKEARFSTDFLPPVSRAIVNVEGQEELIFEESGHMNINSGALVTFGCDDSPIEGNPSYVFGCEDDDVRYCVTNIGDDSCDPNLNAYDLPAEGLLIDTVRKVCFHGIDNGGNFEEVKCIDIVADLSAPVINMDLPEESSLISTENENEYDFITTSNIIQLSGNVVESNSLVSLYAEIWNKQNRMRTNFPIESLSGGIYPFSRNWNLETLGMDDTRYALRIYAEDGVGNINETIINIHYDDAPPLIEDTGSITGSEIYYKDPFSVSVRISDVNWSHELQSVDIRIECNSGPCISMDPHIIYSFANPEDPLTDLDFSDEIVPNMDDSGLYDYRVGNYSLVVSAKDKFGFNARERFDFNIVPNPDEPVNIEQISSRYTNQNRNSLHTFRTTDNSECYFRLDMDDDGNNSVDSDFEPMIASENGRIHEYLLEEYFIDGDYGFSVKCVGVATGQEYMEAFDFIIDTKIPKLLLKSSSGELNVETQPGIQEYFLDVFSGDETEINPRITVSDASLDPDDIVCRFECRSPNSVCPFEDDFFGNSDFQRNQERSFDFRGIPAPAGDYYIDIACQDRAGNKAYADNLVFRVNGKSRLDILNISPSGYVNGDSFTLEAKTNNYYGCEYALFRKGVRGNSYEDYDEDLSTGLTHRIEISDRDEGLFGYWVRCFDEDDTTKIVTRPADPQEFYYDNTAPVINSISRNPNNLLIFDVSVEEEGSGLKGYSYSVSSSEEDPDVMVDSEGVILDQNKIILGSLSSGSYVLNVIAIDNSGNPSSTYNLPFEVSFGNPDAEITTIDGAIEVPSGSDEYYTKDSFVELRFSSSESQRVRLYDVQEEISLNIGSGSGTRTITGLDYGENHYYLYVDSASPRYVKIVRDDAAPEITLHPLDVEDTTEPIRIDTDEDAHCSAEYFDSDGNLVSELFNNGDNPYFRKEHKLDIENSIYTDASGTAIIRVICRDKARNVAKITEEIKVDSRDPEIRSIDVEGHLEEDGSYLIVKHPVAMITVNADEFVKCKWDYNDASYDEMRYFSDDHDMYLLHPRIAIHMEEGASTPVYIRCKDKAMQESRSGRVDIEIDLDHDVIIFDPEPTGTIRTLNPELSVNTYRKAECTATYIKESDGIFAFIFDFINNVFAEHSELESEDMGGYFRHSALLSGLDSDSGDIPEDIASGLDMQQNYTFRVDCDASGIGGASEDIEFAIDYIDFEPPVPEIYLLRSQYFLNR
ncbi:MAG: hypothetical protein ACLFPQ_01060 [Candidatus Woesearchaeota archaeon]